MKNELETYIKNRVTSFNKHLLKVIERLSVPSQLKESMLYSLQAGGKRIRPLLLMAGFEAYSEGIAKTNNVASAIEMIHTYSLIHDDLPAMDNDDYRRGKPSNHKVFDEATAILAGDALLTYAFEVIIIDPLLTDEEKVYIIQKISEASGPKGMVAGQILDIEAETKKISLENLIEIHSKKTGELIKCSVHIGGYLAGAKEKQLYYLDYYAENLGLLFQIQDDILDIIGDEEIIGKPVGSDEKKAKNTYPSLLGLEEAKKYRKRYAEEAKKALTYADAEDSYLYDLIDYVAYRDF